MPRAPQPEPRSASTGTPRNGLLRQENFQAAGELVRPIAVGMAVAHLSAGRDVIMPQFLDADQEIVGFRAAAEETGSGFREIVTMDTKERSVERFNHRG